MQGVFLFTFVILFHGIPGLACEPEGLGGGSEICQEDSPIDSKDPAGGFHGKDSPVLGKKSVDHRALMKEVLKDSRIIRFANAIYYGTADCPDLEKLAENQNRSPSLRFFPASIKSSVDREASFILEDFLDRYSISREDAVLSIPTAEEVGGRIRLVQQGVNSFYVVTVAGTGDVDGDNEFYFPPSLVAVHELGHIERIDYGEFYFQYLRTNDDLVRSLILELPTVVEQFIIADFIRKKIEAFPVERQFQYKTFVPSVNGEINLGFLANLFRDLKNQYGSVDAAVLSQEASQFFETYYHGPTCEF